MSLFDRPQKPHLEDDCPPIAYAEPYLPKHYQQTVALFEERYNEINLPFHIATFDDFLEGLDLMRRNGGEFVVLIHEQKVIGSLAAWPLENEKGRAEFDWFYILMKYEGLGYSAPLYRWAFDWNVRRNIETVELWSGQSRPRTHHLYRNIGFTQNGVKRIVRRNPEYAQYYFELSVTPELISRLQKRFDRLP